MSGANALPTQLLALEGPPRSAALPAPPVFAALPAPAESARPPAHHNVAEPRLAIASTPWPAAGESVAALLPESIPSLSAAQGRDCPHVFVPSYEWAIVGDGTSIPPGLEVRLPVDGSGGRTARIPPNWRMLVVSQPGNDACRLDITRRSTLAEVRTAIAASLAEGDEARVTDVFADETIVASDRESRSWDGTVEQAQLFGRRITSTIAAADNSGLMQMLEDLEAQMGRLDAAVLDVERALGAKTTTAGQAHHELAQLEGQLDRFQCKGIDSIAGKDESAKRRRRELTRRAELLQARLNGLFVGLGAARA